MTNKNKSTVVLLFIDNSKQFYFWAIQIGGEFTPIHDNHKMSIQNGGEFTPKVDSPKIKLL